MKWKILSLIIFIIFLLIIAIGAFVWSYRREIVERYLSKNFHVPVTISRIDYKNGKILIDNLWIGNPHGFHSKTAFASEYITISNLILEKGKILIDTIEMNEVFLGIEYAKPNNNQMNWDYLLTSQKNSRKYLIRNLLLTNFTVVTTNPNEEYPKITKQELHNISDESGLPLEKALLEAILKAAQILIKSEVKS